MRLLLDVLSVPNGTEEISGEAVVFSIREVRSCSFLFPLVDCGSLDEDLRVTNSLVRPICRLACLDWRGCTEEDNNFEWW